MRKPIALLTLVLVAAAATPERAEDFHFALSRSAPAADATVPAPAEIKLWFTQVPRPGSLAVRLVDAGGTRVETEEPAADESDAKVISLRIGRTLPAASYTVEWRGIGDDGHVVQGRFGFRVTAE
jgi:methionine-rich copper-binding protein CopC